MEATSTRSRSKKSAQWFEVDKVGLQQLVGRRGPAFLVTELIQNAWDENVKDVEVSFSKRAPDSPSDGVWALSITDDSPEGFADLRDAFTLFKASKKKGDATKRGRFNLGEKLVLALASEAVLTTTKGQVIFNADGREVKTTGKRKAGTHFSGLFPTLTDKDVRDAAALCKLLIPPKGVATRVQVGTDAFDIEHREPVVTFKESLPTEIDSGDGNLRRTNRKTTVEVYEPWDGAPAGIYELGIPVVSTEDRFIINITQKVPLNLERDNVTPAYLKTLRTTVVNHTLAFLEADDMTSIWVSEALADPRANAETVQRIVRERFGDKAVAFDPSDLEANKLATAAGYTVIGGRAISPEAWSNVRKVDGLLPKAGAVTPGSAMKLQEQLFGAGDGTREALPREKYTEAHKRFESYAQRFAEYTIGRDITVQFHHQTVGVAAGAWYNALSATLSINIARLGKAWIETPDQIEVDALLIHELAHQRVSDHLSNGFHDECCRLGAVARFNTERIGGLV